MAKSCCIRGEPSTFEAPYAFLIRHSSFVMLFLRIPLVVCLCPRVPVAGLPLAQALASQRRKGGEDRKRSTAARTQQVSAPGFAIPLSGGFRIETRSRAVPRIGRPARPGS